MTTFQRHKLKWKSCERCDLCKTRDKVVLLRGKIPADVLFIGEAPGPSEDVIGQPFVGPAGHLLDEIIESAFVDAFVDPNILIYDRPRTAFTNLVACIPKSEETGNKFSEPPDYAIKECRPRVEELIDLLNPSLIVCVGQLAEKHLPSYWEGRKVAIVHPAAILRADISQRSLAIKRCVLTLSEAFAKLV